MSKQTVSRVQIVRRLTLESQEVLGQWQQDFLPASFFEFGVPVKSFNSNPTISIVGKKLVQEYFHGRSKAELSIPEGLKRPISMLPIGISVRPPLRNKFSMLNMTFDEPDVFIDQRTQILEQNGAGDRVGHYSPGLFVGSVRIESLTLDAIAEAVNNRPDVLHFMPAEIEKL